MTIAIAARPDQSVRQRPQWEQTVVHGARSQWQFSRLLLLLLLVSDQKPKISVTIG